MTPIPEAVVLQTLDLPRKLPLDAAVSTGLRLLRSLLAHLPPLHRVETPDSAVLRDLGLDHQSRADAFHFADIHHGLEWSRMRFLDTRQGWRGS